MFRKTEATIFIQTLAEMLDQERQRQKVVLRLQIKARVRRFVEKFRTQLKGNLRASDWTPQARRTPPGAARKFRVD